MGWGEFWDAAAGWAIIWIPVLGPLGILATALIAYFAYRQKLEADRRAQWWVRAQWALEATLSANPRRSLAGLAVLNDLKTSSLATKEDRELFRLIALTAREELVGTASLRAPEGASSQQAQPAGVEALIREQTERLLLDDRPGPPAGSTPAPPEAAR